MALPIAYFEARRTGDSIARVRELENIRNFLTGSALTLVIDLFFTFVFLIVMAYYSVFLTGVVLASFFLQLFALVSPLFFQVVIDKVLVHRSLGTLDVLVIGLLTISTFETIDPVTSTSTSLSTGSAE